MKRDLRVFPKCLKVLNEPTAGVLCVTFGNERLFAGTLDSTIHQWDQATFSTHAKITKQHSASIFGLALDEMNLFSCGNEVTINHYRFDVDQIQSDSSSPVMQ